jgi:hypothetical protein
MRTGVASLHQSAENKIIVKGDNHERASIRY